MKAAPKDQRRLLDLQAVDTSLAQLAHRRKTLPEFAELDTLARTLSALEDERVRAQVTVDDIDRDIARLERDIDQVRLRRQKDDDRLAAGTGPARELEALQHEVASLTRRQSELEDQELELMEQRETAQATLDEIGGRQVAARENRVAAEARRDAALLEITKEEEYKAKSRTPLASDLPGDLIALYDRLREANAGLGAALFRAGRCGGCRLELYGQELHRVKAAPADDVVRCEECGRIMVRTAESGL
ncbi:zinc ribbon domain-containing protein [Catenuloplanes japonicus]|uniref:zinc ribbon domain-containing protein n=1 Tax=Catenuloplanes japonicus TaxID=33876 RepID=UPI0005240A98|nr:C4-type zinc ribbon domain-containing protein [Catenuloplanes japonicus]